MAGLFVGCGDCVRDLGFSSEILCAVVLFHFEKAQLALEGIRQFHVDGEIEEMKLDTFCDLHVTPRLGSSGFLVCWPRFGMRVHSRYLGIDAQGTPESWSEWNLAKKLAHVDHRFLKVQAGVLVLLLRQRGRLSAPREEAVVLFLFCYFARETTMGTPGHITITRGSNGPSTRAPRVMPITSFGSHVSSCVLVVCCSGDCGTVSPLHTSEVRCANSGLVRCLRVGKSLVRATRG